MNTSNLNSSEFQSANTQNHPPTNLYSLNRPISFPVTSNTNLSQAQAAPILFGSRSPNFETAPSYYQFDQIGGNPAPSNFCEAIPSQSLVETKSLSVLTPKVDAAREFLEIATDFSNPLDLVRESISNSIDAGASEIHISFNTEMDAGDRILICDIEDNGSGMNQQGLQSFFDLGNSTRRSDPNAIGEKGHGAGYSGRS
jgi:hypothetical protein